ncbi:cob(I)yrinic acid a,c-diamide adenosyltransferase [Candidatus Uhrbacteria bacterium]|nr:cob(I)yrinic acid a,c-diamide adenosyltransferase [Candidatus Uhrbacteria bacterium]
MSLYTKTGDQGETGLYGGRRVRKDHARVCAYGTVDEAGSAIGLAAASPGVSSATRETLLDILSDLFDLGAELAAPSDHSHAVESLSARLDSRVSVERVAEFEAIIDYWEARLPPLTSFVLPTGSETAARLQAARSAVRRAEREAVSLADQGEMVREQVIHYLNRLSDLLFILARASNHESGYGDLVWKGKKMGKTP